MGLWEKPDIFLVEKSTFAKRWEDVVFSIKSGVAIYVFYQAPQDLQESEDQQDQLVPRVTQDPRG